MSRGLFALCALALVAPLAPLWGQGARLYVTNQDDATVSVVDLATRRVAETVDLQPLGFAANARPHHTQVEPDGSHWYVTLIGAGKVLKLDRANRVVGSVDLQVPGLLALDPASDLLYVARSMSAVNPPARLAIIRRSDMTLVDEVDVFFPRPHALVVAPGGRAYVASLGVNQLASVGPEGDVRVVDLPGPPGGYVALAISPGARWLSLTAQLSDRIVILDLADPLAPRVVREISVADGPFESVFSRDGQELWVTNLDANQVSVIRTDTWEVASVLEHDGFAQPHGITRSPDGAWIWLSNRHQHGGAHDHEGGKATGKGTVMAICAATREVAADLPVGAYAAGLSVPTDTIRAPVPVAACR